MGARESPMSREYSRKKRQVSNGNPLLTIPAETVKQIIVSMKTLNQAFDELARSYGEYKEKKAATDDEQPEAVPEQAEENVDDAEMIDEETDIAPGPEIEYMDAEDQEDRRRSNNSNQRRNFGGRRRRNGSFSQRRRNGGRNN